MGRTSCCERESCIETEMPVGMCVRRMADSVLLTCCIEEGSATVEVGRGGRADLATSTSRAHDFDLDILLLEEIVVYRCFSRFGRKDLQRVISSSPRVQRATHDNPDRADRKSVV